MKVSTLKALASRTNLEKGWLEHATRLKKTSLISRVWNGKMVNGTLVLKIHHKKARGIL